jgi:hypothetical protein
MSEMVRREVVTFSLTGLDGADLTVLDLALCRIQDDMNKAKEQAMKPLQTAAQRQSLQRLHQLVLDAKRDG